MQQGRAYARPNLSFFQQLVQFEADCLGTNSTDIVQESMDFEVLDPKEAESKRKKKTLLVRNTPEQFIYVPDFYRKDYPHLFKLEIEQAKKIPDCPMVSSGLNQSPKRIPCNGVTKQRSMGKIFSRMGAKQRRSTVKGKRSSKALRSLRSKANSLKGSSRLIARSAGLKATSKGTLAMRRSPALRSRKLVGKGASSKMSYGRLQPLEPEQTVECMNDELKPFVVESISYGSFLKELAQVRANNCNLNQANRPAGTVSLGKVLKTKN